MKKVRLVLLVLKYSTNVRHAEREGYKPHGGHPIGEAAHVDGKQTWLDYRNNPNLPVARAEPGDL